MPIFWESGFTRQDVLVMKHWEVELYIRSYYKNQAKKLLALTDSLALGNGFLEEDTQNKILDRLMVQAGYRKKVVSHNWLSELKAFAGGR